MVKWSEKWELIKYLVVPSHASQLYSKENVLSTHKRCGTRSCLRMPRQPVTGPLCVATSETEPSQVWVPRRYSCHFAMQHFEILQLGQQVYAASLVERNN